MWKQLKYSFVYTEFYFIYWKQFAFIVIDVQFTLYDASDGDLR